MATAPVDSGVLDLKLAAPGKLRSLGMEVNELTDEQKRYLESWEMGT